MPPLYLRQCIALYGVAEGWLLLNIRWFVLLMILIPAVNLFVIDILVICLWIEFYFFVSNSVMK